MKVLATNRELKFKYEIIELLEAGIELKGTEVKSVRDAKITLNDSFVIIRNNEAIAKNIYIAPYDKSIRSEIKELRDRRLLLHKEEILKLEQTTKQTSFTIIPFKVGLVGQNVKVQIAICKGKKLYDKRDEIKKRDIEREVLQTLKQRK